MNGSDERDRSVERLLRQSLKAPQRGVTDSCLDAETIAAWADGGLFGAALEIAQSHVADCARCQALAGAMARTHAVVREPEPAPRRWLAWLVPLTAVAAAVALWIAVPRDSGAPPSPATGTQRQTADAKASEPPLVGGQLQAPAPAAQKEEQASQAKADLPSRDQAQGYELRKDAGRRRETDRLNQRPEPAGKAAASASPDQGASALAAAPPPAALEAREAVQARPANAVAETVAIAGIVIVSPDPSVRWRLVRSAVQRSTNGGSSWDSVPTGAQAELTAGVAPSASVCWIVGRSGLVLLSTDGRSLSRVAFPDMTDLSAVRATDARTASVSTSDGRTFSTTDGGATWTRP